MLTGTLVTGQADTPPVLIDTSTGQKQQLVLAIQQTAVPPAGTTARLTLTARADAPKNYKQYTYRRDTTFDVISGIESTASQKSLQFTAYGVDPDLVEVFVDGVKLEQGTGAEQFQIYDGSPTSAVAPNTIKFNSPVVPSGTTQVDVIVSKIGVVNQVHLDFIRNADNPERLETGAWENVSSITRFVGGAWQTYYLYTYDVLDNDDLVLNTILYPSQPVSINGGLQTAALSRCFFALARKPYATIDRYHDLLIPLSTLSSDRDFLKYHRVDGMDRLEVTKTSVEIFFPTAKITTFNIEPPISVQVGGVTEQITVDGKVVVGPDK